MYVPFVPRVMVGRLLGLLLLLGAWTSFISCNYVERFIIKLQEPATNFPCVGVSHFAFVIEGLREGQLNIVKNKYTQQLANSSLFWDPATGRCKFPAIPLNKIPYGGERQLRISGYDATGTLLISSGTTERFVVEASGPEVRSILTIPFRRNPKVSVGTLLIRFETPLPVGTAILQVIFKQQGTLPQEIRPISIEETAPSFVILSNIPAAAARPLVVKAFNIRNQPIGESEETSYTLSLDNPGKFMRRVVVGFRSKP